MPQRTRFSGLICVWGSADPRGPNFAEIHARGRRGRLESDHRDLIPPWGHGLLHGEAERQAWQSGMISMKVCSIMADRDGGRREPWDDTTQQDALVQQTADPGDIRGNRGGKSGRSSTQQLLSRDLHVRTMCLYAGFPGVTSSRLRPYPDCIGRSSAASLAKRRLYGGDRRRWRAYRGQKAPFFHTLRLAWAASVRKTAGKRRRRV